MVFESIAIVGLGLVGGSFAKSVRRHFPETHITACDTNAQALERAAKDGVIDAAYESIGEGLNDIAAADLILLAAPVTQCMDALAALAPHAGMRTVISDVCSVKSALISRARELNRQYGFVFISGHPMAGSETGGYDASSPNLLENAIYLLCPMAEDERHKYAADSLTDLIAALGGLPMRISPEKHDESVAVISHIPHIAAAALCRLALAREDGQGTLRALASGGFRDSTRIASGSAQLWTGITLANRDAVLPALRDYIFQLERFESWLETSDGESIGAFFAGAKHFRDSLGQGRASRGWQYEVAVDVPDRPGIIAAVSQELAKHDINIRNMYIAESRQNEGGCLHIALSTPEGRDRAAEALAAAGFAVQSL